MTVLHALRADWLIALYLTVAGFAIAWTLYHLGRIVRLYFCRWRTRRLIRQWNRSDARRLDVYGDTAIKELGSFTRGSITRSTERENRIRIVMGPWRPRW